ncbi:MAG: hypothetical protein JOY70_01845 [Acidisphaera sp.]|nr:hypothetical protein [Acidisphaera sp.]
MNGAADIVPPVPAIEQLSLRDAQPPADTGTAVSPPTGPSAEPTGPVVEPADLDESTENGAQLNGVTANSAPTGADGIVKLNGSARHDAVPGAIRALPPLPGEAEPAVARAARKERGVDASALERAGLLVMSKMRSRISEELRMAVNQVLRTVQKTFNAGHPAANLVMVTSARPGEGKSFMSLNLAGCIALQNQREVLLVDTDAKARPLTQELGLEDAPGLLDLARDPTMRIEDVIAPTALATLSVLPIGRRQAEVDDDSHARPISAIVERIGRRFGNRIIVVDTPPCLATSDPSEIAPIVGQVVMVVEAERTQRHELEAALDLVATCPTVALMLNKVQRSTSHTFGAYHYLGTYS